MSDATTVFAGIQIPSTDPVFLWIVAIHIPLGLICVVTGAVAMVSMKAPGRHPTLGRIYYWTIVAIFITATALSFMRWTHNRHLLVLGVLTLAAAHLGRTAASRRWPGWIRVHIAGMGLSYVLLLTAFYVDNGKQLPLWRDLPVWTYWTLPMFVGAPIIIWAVSRHPLVLR
jgi:hypothetical protein